MQVIAVNSETVCLWLVDHRYDCAYQYSVLFIPKVRFHIPDFETRVLRTTLTEALRLGGGYRRLGATGRPGPSG